jgi:MEMO1 family protein
VSAQLPRLRLDLDFLPSPVEDRPGLLIRDGCGYTDVMLVIPPPLVACLQLFDGEHSDLDLKAELVRISGQLDVSDLQEQFVSSLGRAGFLHDELFEQLREARHREFTLASVREPSHAGSAYPADPAELEDTLREYLDGAAAPAGKLIGIAAPHVSPFGGIRSYRGAYNAPGEDWRDKTFVVLGTSHHGEADRFGLTRKAFETPFGRTRTELGIVDRLGQQKAVLMEDYCHAIEHSIEFQVVFLQYLFGPDIKVVPILCGPFWRSLTGGGVPEDDDDVRAFFDELGEIGAREGDNLRWVLGIDMAHIGRRYGDPWSVKADEGRMLEVSARDQERIECVTGGDPGGFWDLVKPNRDDLKWCGSAPLYTFLKAMPQARGTLREYQHWNIDDDSVVSFGAIAFRDPT